ncbi:crossover junction endodeoxyribonuclease RuvC [Pseudomonadota bacterium]
MMRVLGVDPGSRVTGYGVIDVHGNDLGHVDSGCLRVVAEGLSARLKLIYDGLSDVIDRHCPDVICIEQVFMARNPQSALTLGHARGAAMCAGVNRDLPTFEYSALQIKQAVVGRGRADKEQVQHMVRVLLGLRQKPAADAADALACAICHIHTEQIESRLRSAVEAVSH